MVRLVIRMIDFTVQQFEYQGNSGLFRDWRNSRQTRSCDLDSLCIIETLPIPAEADQVPNS